MSRGGEGGDNNREEGKYLLECWHNAGEWYLCRRVYYAITHQRLTLQLSNLF